MARYVRQHPTRLARPAEIELLARLQGGPQLLADGPVGRCLKKGWCRLLPGRDESIGPTVVLTDAGADVLRTVGPHEGGSGGRIQAQPRGDLSMSGGR